MTTSSLVLHLVSEALPQNDLNNVIKSIILEKLRENPDQSIIETVLGEIKTLEAGAYSVFKYGQNGNL